MIGKTCLLFTFDKIMFFYFNSNNFIQDLNIEKTLEMVLKFEKTVSAIVESVTTGVELLKELMSSGYMKDIIDEFRSAVSAIPSTVGYIVYIYA